MGKLLVTTVSDTHQKYPEGLLGGDVLIDCGDFSFRGREQEVENHMKWLLNQTQLYRYVVFIAGNHELSFQDCPGQVRKWLKPYLSDRLIYLQEESVVIDGYTIYGAPHQPEFGYWAFNVRRGKLHKHWDKIPIETDILVTHGPPRGYGDFVPERTWVRNALGEEGWETLHRHEGCDELVEALARVQPQAHLFGHIHYASGKYYGKAEDGIEGMLLINAAQCGENYELMNKPYSFQLDAPKVSPIPLSSDEGTG